MAHVILKISKTTLWLLLPFLFISNGRLSENLSKIGEIPELRTYDLGVTGNLNKMLKGSINYRNAVKISDNGTAFSTLQLVFKNGDERQPCFFGFLISKKSQFDKISEGTYKVTKDTDGFLNCNEGIFGVADIKMLGEAPFFGYQGEIIIKKIDESGLHGLISMGLKNPSGKKIKISGSFLAQQEVKNREIF